ncbi:MAG: DUF4387 domain-containing protein [Verrucomicrobiae bacterium]|nr:DUF4387 domain-containing protein [Verrucomicrobiae bacterium]
MKKTRLMDLAHIIRSKNSGPYELTLDVFFKTEKIYQTVKKRNLINKTLIKRLYRVEENRILDIIYFDPVRAVKATIARPIPSGAVEDTDVYGAQQHMPLVDAIINF